MRRISLLIAFFFLFASPPVVYAGDIVINEFAIDADTQWVELYNKGAAAVDVSGWILDDAGSPSQKFVIPNSTILTPTEFKVFESSLFNFNSASADEVRLFNGVMLEDSYAYENSTAIQYSFGRQTDGGGIWVVFQTPTKGGTNNAASVIPTPSNTPIPTVTPTTVPTATRTPTPVKTATPAPSATPTKTPSLYPSQPVEERDHQLSVSVTTTHTASISPSITKKQSDINIVLQEDTPPPLPTQTVAVLGSSHTTTAYVFLLMGAGFMALCGILGYQIYQKEKG